MNETKYEKNTVLWNYAFWGWIGIFILGFLIASIKYGALSSLSIGILLYPIFICLFFPPLIIIYPKTNDPLGRLASFLALKIKIYHKHTKPKASRKYPEIPDIYKLWFSPLTIVFIGIALRLTRSIYGFPVTAAVGDLITIFGIVWVGYILLNKERVLRYQREAELNEKIVICPNCKKTFYYKDIKDNLCTGCNSVIEDLNGFYERHPELRQES